MYIYSDIYSSIYMYTFNYFIYTHTHRYMTDVYRDHSIVLKQ